MVEQWILIYKIYYKILPAYLLYNEYDFAMLDLHQYIVAWHFRGPRPILHTCTEMPLLSHFALFQFMLISFICIFFYICCIVAYYMYALINKRLK